MRTKVRPSGSSSDAPISQTSRHELKQMKQIDSSNLQSNQFSLSNLRLKFFINRLIKKMKFLSPPNKTPENVKEQWQKLLQEQQSSQRLKQAQIFRKQTLSEQIINRNSIYPVIQIFHGILIVLFSWAVTISLIFEIYIFTPLYVILVVFNISELIMKISIIGSDQNKQTTYQIYWKEDFIQPFYLLLAALLMIVRNYADSYYFQIFLHVFELVCICMQWRNIGKYFAYLTLYAQHNKKRKQLRIIELFCFTLVMAHIFALVMYEMAKFTPEGQTNWIQKANLDTKPWYALYIYSYYWANTTMVTVGYGDLSPSNYFQAIIITLIEIVGTAIFGYMINVIGITVSQIQKKNVEFQEYQSTIFKLRDHYQLSRELCYKMKSDIKKKEFEMKQTPLKNNQQRQFLQYVDPTLKQEFVLQTNMKVIKKSIFFLTHFTVNCQNEIALKLIRCIYKPDELINFQQNGQKQMVIIYSGKVNIHYRKMHHNQEIIKVVRVIKPSEQKPALNVYGYSSLILNKNLNLKAVTEQTTTAYILKRSDITDSIKKNIFDFESFNELRQRMLQYVNFEEVQVPALKQQERHFIPNIYLLIKKIKNSSQPRMKLNRYNRRLRMKVVTIKHYQNKTLLLIPNERKTQQDEFQLNFLNEVEDIAEINNKGSQLQKNNSRICMLEQGKNFVNFLRNYNPSVIAEQYEKACLRKSYKKRRIQGWSFRSKITNNPYEF